MKTTKPEIQATPEGAMGRLMQFNIADEGKLVSEWTLRFEKKSVEEQVALLDRMIRALTEEKSKLQPAQMTPTGAERAHAVVIRDADGSIDIA